jgi:hypothetical protein
MRDGRRSQNDADENQNVNRLHVISSLWTWLVELPGLVW